MKKRLFTILFASAMVLAGCGNSDPQVPTLNSITITNKDALEADWYTDGAERTVEITSNPALDYSKEWKLSGHLRLSVEDSTVVEYQGFGNVITPKKAGSTKVFVTYYGISYDSFTVTIPDQRAEPAVITNATLLKIEGDTSSADAVQKYTGTYEVATIAYDAFGNMTVKDATHETPVVVYGASKNFAFTWVSPGKYSYTNPKDFDKDEELMAIEPGDQVVVDCVAILYNKTKLELFFKINEVIKKVRPAVESVSINTDGLEVEAGLAVQLEATALPEGSSQLFTWSVEPGTGYATINDNGMLVPSRPGDVTVYARALTDDTKFASVVITIGESSDTGLVFEPVDGESYKMSFWRNGAHYYYNGEVANTYYGGSTETYEDAVDVTFEKVGTKWAIKALLKKDAKGTDVNVEYYLGVHEGGGHINWKYDLTQPTCLAEWNPIYNTLVFSDIPDGATEAKEYILCNDSTNKATFRASEASGLGGTTYVPVHFHSAKPLPPAIEEITVAKAIEIGNALADNASTSKQYYITGVVVKKYTWSTDYKNADFKIDDAADLVGSTWFTVFRFGDKTVFDSLVEKTTIVKVKCSITKYVKDSKVTIESNTNPEVQVLSA